MVKPNYLAGAGLKLWRNKIHLIEDGGHLVYVDQLKKFNSILKSFAKDIFKNQ